MWPIRETAALADLLTSQTLLGGELHWLKPYGTCAAAGLSSGQRISWGLKNMKRTSDANLKLT